MPRQAFAWGVDSTWVAKYAGPNWRSTSAKVAMRRNYKESVGCLQLGQTSQQVQWVNVFWRTKLWADQVQVAAGGADVAVAQQFLDGEEVDTAFEQVGSEPVAQGVGAAFLGDARALA